MLGHLGLNVPDLRRAKEYYDQFMPALGFESFFSHDDEFAYRPAGGKTRHLHLLLPGGSDQVLRPSTPGTPTFGVHGQDPHRRARDA
jgi:catechol 2,3-dioxygenase-like lactoylglutathione lyase family enzyme